MNVCSLKILRSNGKKTCFWLLENLLQQLFKWKHVAHHPQGSCSGQTSTKHSNTHTNNEISHEAEHETVFSFYLVVCLRTFLTWEKLRILVELVHDDPVVIWQLVQKWFMIINEYNYFWTVIFLLWNIYKIGNENPKNALFNNTVGQHDTFMKNGLICAVRSFLAVHDTYQSKVCVMVRLCSRVS